MNEQELTRAEKRALKKQEVRGHHHHLKTMQALRIGATVVIILMAAGYGGYAFNTWRKGLPERPFTDGPVHWHAKVNVEICGEARKLPGTEEGSNSAVGGHLLHHHHDGVAHIEGKVTRPEDISLGKFFDSIGGNFSPSQIFEKKNGDVCPDGKSGEVKFLVNGMENSEWRDYGLRDGDKIDIKFE